MSRLTKEQRSENALKRGWAITKNYISTDTNSASTLEYSEEVTNSLPHRFQLADGDDIVYFEGISSDDSSFKPLDDWATGDYGCTYILYWNDNTSKFEPL
jgi:hypothetical protein